MVKRKKRSEIEMLYKKLTTNQSRFLKKYIKTEGHIYKSCTHAGVHRQSFYDWQKLPVFKQVLNEIQELFLDQYESILQNRIKDDKRDKNGSLLMFMLKSKARGRGYVDRSEVGIENIDEVDKLRKAYEESKIEDKKEIVVEAEVKEDE